MRTLLFLLAICLIYSCTKPLKDVADYYPVVRIVAHTVNIDGSITITAEIEDEGASEPEFTGFSMSTNGTPSGSENQLLGNANGNNFTVTYDYVVGESGEVIELHEDSTYYVRAFV